MSFGFSGLCRGRYSTAHLVAHDDEQRRVQMRGRILDARDLGVTGDVTRHSNVEEIAEPLIEDDFWRDAGIGTAQDGRVGMLSRRQFPLPCGGLMGVLISFGDVMAVARFQLPQHGISRLKRLLGRNGGTAHGNSSKNSHHHGSHDHLLAIPSHAPASRD